SRELDRRSDIYSLGAVTYFLLTGRPVFPYEGAPKVIAAHIKEPVEPPSRLRPEIPADVEAVVLRCLEKDPGNRFANAEELAAALRRCACATDWTAEQAAAWWREHPAADATGPAA